jgi:site-specific recombinase XerD
LHSIGRVHFNSKKRSYLDIIIHKTQAAVKLPLSPAAIELLSKPKKRGLVFPDLTGYKLGFYIPRLLKLAKIEKYITFHCFRHTFAMRLLENGVDIYTITTLLGHKSVSSTQVYARLSLAQVREAVMNL